MSSRLLNFPNALRLASICVKHFSLGEIGKMTPSEFSYALLDISTEEEMEFLLGLSKSESLENKLSKEIPEILMENGILELIEFYTQIGGK